MRRRVGRFSQEESGAVTVEMVIWLPFIFGLLMIITDVSLAFFGKAEAFRLIQDLNRAVSVGKISADCVARTQNQAETVLMEAFEQKAPNSTVEVCVANGIVRTVMTMQAKDLILFSAPFLYNFSDLTFEVGAQHYVEWPNL